MMPALARERPRSTRAPRGRRAVRLVLLSGLLLGSASCVYYNTFFIAKKSFNAAESSVARSRTDQVPPDATTNYEMTIAQCRKVLTRHPKSKWADDAVYMMGASYYGKGDYDSALIRLNQLMQTYPKSKFRPDALFLIGMTQNKRHNYAEGQAAFDQVLREYPRYSRRDEIYYTIADGAEARRDHLAAIRGYERIVRELPKSRRMEDALQRIGQIYFDGGKYDSASIAFGRMYSLARDDHSRADAAVLEAQTLLRLQRPEDALKVVRESIPKETSQPSGGGYNPPDQQYYGGLGNPQSDAAIPTSSPGDDVPRLRLQEAAALNQMGKTNDALTTLQGILTRYSTSNYAVEAQFQIGYTYETVLDSLEEARTAYEKVATLPGRSVFKDQAAQRAVAVRSFIALQKQAQKENVAEEARAATALRLAESLLLDRGLTKEAKDSYKKLEEDFPKTRSAARACYALAYIRWKMDADSVGAQQDFRDLVARFPDSPQARGAIKLLASQGADTAGLIHLLQAIVPDSAQAAVHDSASAGVADSTLARARADTLAARATTVQGEGAPLPDAVDSLRLVRRIPPPRPPDLIRPPRRPNIDEGPTQDRKGP